MRTASSCEFTPRRGWKMHRAFTSALGLTTMATAAALSIDHAALGRVALKTWPEAKMVSASQLWATGPCLMFAVRRMG